MTAVAQAGDGDDRSIGERLQQLISEIAKSAVVDPERVLSPGQTKSFDRLVDILDSRFRVEQWSPGVLHIAMRSNVPAALPTDRVTVVNRGSGADLESGEGKRVYENPSGTCRDGDHLVAAGSGEVDANRLSVDITVDHPFGSLSGSLRVGLQLHHFILLALCGLVTRYVAGAVLRRRGSSQRKGWVRRAAVVLRPSGSTTGVDR